jgi:hypothetical protein
MAVDTRLRAALPLGGGRTVVAVPVTGGATLPEPAVLLTSAGRDAAVELAARRCDVQPATSRTATAHTA